MSQTFSKSKLLPGGFGYPFLESLKPSSLLTLPLTTKGAHLETAISLPDDVLLWLDLHASAQGVL